MAELSHILCVDDEPDVLFLARRSLEKVGGFTVTPASGGMSALEVLGAARPDLILLDVMMPEIDGPATLKLIRANPDYDGIPVIFITARVRSSEVEEYLALGACGVLAKPFDPMSLPNEVRAIWDQTHAAA